MPSSNPARESSLWLRRRKASPTRVGGVEKEKAPRTLTRRPPVRMQETSRRDRYLEWYHGRDADAVQWLDTRPLRNPIPLPLACTVCGEWGTGLLGDSDFLRAGDVMVTDGLALGPCARGGGVLPPSLVVPGPCEIAAHAVCGGCLSAAVRAGVSDPLRCMHPGRVRCRARFTPKDVDPFLASADFSAFAARCLRSDMVAVPCAAQGCAGEALAPWTATVAGGDGIARCESCAAETCFFCLQGSGGGGGAGECDCSARTRALGAWNFHVSGGSADTPVARRDAISPARAALLLRAIGEDDAGRVECPCCLVVLQKTTDCNALSHCGIERCNTCALVSLPGQALPASHWDVCPRYDFSPEWASVHGCPDYHCRGGVCHDDDVDCELAAHAEGRAQMLRARKRIREGALRAALES
jgi:hypothetical protein